LSESSKRGWGFSTHFVVFLFYPTIQQDPQQRQVLLDLFEATNGKQWSRSDNWTSEYPYCLWYGVSCDGINITYLELQINEMSGEIPSSLGRLTQLIYLDLSGNQLVGTIPASLGQLDMLLYLDLQFNLLSGTIPTSLGQLNQLQFLDLGHNLLSGTIPTYLGQLNLLYGLKLDSNGLIGPIPSSLGNLKSLQDLELSYNHLNGTIPFGELANIYYLMVEYNQLQYIPLSLKQPPYLSECELSHNPFSCPLPDWVLTMCSATCRQVEMGSIS